MKKIVTLLPSATEIVCAVGGRCALVGVSHECDHPPGVESLPRLTRARSRAADTSGAIDSSVREALRDALSVYEVFEDVLERLAPDVIVTQDLCDVCAVSRADVDAAVAARLRKPVEVVSLAPTTLADVLGDVRRVGAAIGRAEEADRVVGDLEARIEQVRRSAAALSPKPSVVTVEWMDPVMPGGLWMPELIEIAGGVPLLLSTGEKSRVADLSELAAVDPDVVVVKPCGFTLERALSEREILRDTLPWDAWSAAREGRVYVTDGNAWFNRPGPRIVDSLEVLAAILHPGRFPEYESRHFAKVRRLLPDLSVVEAA